MSLMLLCMMHFWRQLHKEMFTKHTLLLRRLCFAFLTAAIQLFLMKKRWCLRISQQQFREKKMDFFPSVVEFPEAALTGVLGTLWQVKSQTHRSSSASSSHEPPNMRQRSCSQLSAPDPEPPEPQSASQKSTETWKGRIISRRRRLTVRGNDKQRQMGEIKQTN